MFRQSLVVMKSWTILALSLATLSSSAFAGEAAPAAPKPAAASAAVVDGYFRAGFDVLASFPFVPPEPDLGAKPGTPPPSAASQIPAPIKALDGKKVIVTGYMLPTKMEKGLVTEFLLVSSPAACCYGATPQMNEFIVVKMGKGVKSVMDTPVEFYGKLLVKEVVEEGFLSNIYTLEGEKMGKSATD
jgi:hypothetical protein